MTIYKYEGSVHSCGMSYDRWLCMVCDTAILCTYPSLSPDQNGSAAADDSLSHNVAADLQDTGNRASVS